MKSHNMACIGITCLRTGHLLNDEINITASWLPKSAIDSDHIPLASRRTPKGRAERQSHEESVIGVDPSFVIVGPMKTS